MSSSDFVIISLFLLQNISIVTSEGVDSVSKDGYFYNSSVLVLADDVDQENQLVHSPQSVFLAPGMNFGAGNPLESSGTLGTPNSHTVGAFDDNHNILQSFPSNQGVLEAFGDLAVLGDLAALNGLFGEDTSRDPDPQGQSDSLLEPQEDWEQITNPQKESFSMTMDGMMEALMEVQRRGDRMMQGIQKQKQILQLLEVQVVKAEGILKETETRRKQEEDRLEEVKTSRKQEEERVEEVETLRQQEEQKLEEVTAKRQEIEDIVGLTEAAMYRLSEEARRAELHKQSMIEETQELVRSVQELNSKKTDSSQQVKKLNVMIEPLEKEYSTRTKQMQDLDRTIQAKIKKLEKYNSAINTSTKSLNDLRSSLAEEKINQQAIESIVPSSMSTSAERFPYILPVFAVSIIGNVLLGGSFLASKLSTIDRMDTVMQFTASDNKKRGVLSRVPSSSKAPRVPRAPFIPQPPKLNTNEESIFAPEGYYNIPQPQYF